MPQVFYQSIASHTQLVLWHVTEPESFFGGAARGIRAIAHPHKRLQHLCGRYLLQMLVPHFPLEQIVAEHNNKPFLPDHPYHFSISHCDDYVAAIVSTTLQVGIDVETIRPKVAAIRHKFLTAAEESLLRDVPLPFSEMEKLTLAWSTKEAMFKWLSEKEIDFKEHLVLQQLYSSEAHQLVKAQFRKTIPQTVDIHFRIWNGLVLTWLAS